MQNWVPYIDVESMNGSLNLCSNADMLTYKLYVTQVRANNNNNNKICDRLWENPPSGEN